MSREKKKGTSGNAKAFITRAKALKKLQLSLPEFRRLCILKGIYPRDPRKKLEGSDKTYYLRKDIDFLRHERLIETVRQENAHKKKETKARAKRRIDVLKRLALSKPKARLDHLVVERYPHFTDAIRELDDPLCIVALFANLPADHKVGIAPRRVTNCQRLLREFHNFVAETHALRRVFVSIKGYYFQARLEGELVTWVTPHRFSQVLPADVDYSVMLTFLELYECILSFVNFRLYTTKNLAYPPKISRVADANGLELASVEIEEMSTTATTANGVNGMEVDDGVDDSVVRISEKDVKKAQKLVMKAEQAEEETDEEEGEEDEEVKGDEQSRRDKGEVEDTGEQNTNVGKSDGELVQEGIFTGKSFVLGREVPYVELEFALKASGALKVTREDDLAEGPNRTTEYTHWVIDRPNVSGTRDMLLEYVQPQYVFDSINATVLLPTSLYAPGANLPPHLSPFVTDEDDGGYRPWFKDVLDRIKAGDASVVAEAAAVVYAEGVVNARKLSDVKADFGRGGDSEILMSKSKKKVEKRKSKPYDLQGKEASVGENADIRVDVTAAGSDVDKEPIHADGSGQDDAKRGTDNDESEDSGEEDEEEEEETAAKSAEAKLEKEGTELATLMLSRKKMRQYKRHKREEKAKSAVKERLVAKRKHLENERSPVEHGKSGKRQRKAN